MSIVSIQSHVAYGFVGNKAAVFPLQSMGYDLWAINTVQFSNHTGYGHWGGDIFLADHVERVLKGLWEHPSHLKPQAFLSGYLGSGEIGAVIQSYYQAFKVRNEDLIYLCDPVLGDRGRGLFVKPDVSAFLKTAFQADIITPNHFEIEYLTGETIQTAEKALKIAQGFHEKGIRQVLITSFETREKSSDEMAVFLSDEGKGYLAFTPYYDFSIAPNGTGDLFSALYLGYYLQFQEASKALGYALARMNEIMSLTYRNQERELAILGSSYQEQPDLSSIKIRAL